MDLSRIDVRLLSRPGATNRGGQPYPSNMFASAAPP